MSGYFNQLKNEFSAINKIASLDGVIGFFGQEVLRFLSISGTILVSFKADKSSCADEERYITHILTRSLIENYFWLLYIFDDPSAMSQRYINLLNSFKGDYYRLLNEPLLQNKDKLEPSDPTWQGLRAMDTRSMLDQLRNDYGDRLSYLYFIYRIASFDTHGKNLNNVLKAVFSKNVNFPILDINYAFELMANQYLIILNELRETGKVL